MRTVHSTKLYFLRILPSWWLIEILSDFLKKILHKEKKSRKIRLAKLRKDEKKKVRAFLQGTAIVRKALIRRFKSSYHKKLERMEEYNLSIGDTKLQYIQRINSRKLNEYSEWILFLNQPKTSTDYLRNPRFRNVKRKCYFTANVFCIRNKRQFHLIFLNVFS